MKNRELTDRQKEILCFIVEHIKKFGFPPTIPEIQKGFRFKSPTAVNDHLNALAKKGFVIRHPNKSRGIEVVNFDNNIQSETNVARIPIVGRVAAGTPILAEENIEGYLSLDKSLMQQPGNTFALKVRGDSMIKTGILDGDYVIINKQPTVEEGEIAAVVVDNEATVKRVFFDKNLIKLQPENDSLIPIYINPREQEVFVAGKVKAVIRKI